MKVINAHHFGGVEKLPQTAKYIGRPSRHGNAYSSKSGKFTPEQAVAFNRIDIYTDLTNDPSYMTELKRELYGYDLACWCKNERYLKICHGDNYIHIFTEELLTRDYSRSVIFYLMDDLRRALKNLESWLDTLDNPTWFPLSILREDVWLEIKFFLYVLSDKKPDVEVVREYLAQIVIYLELAHREVSIDAKRYWLLYTDWFIAGILYPEDFALEEPVNPRLRKPSKKR